ncbi:MAG: hypothetical protein LAQ69_48445, partial [Acidobacteriia bacterium]|nr:hypothetical protein [Terriglobia bacterium]
GKGAVDDADLLIGLARQEWVQHADGAIDPVDLFPSDGETELERVVPVGEARDIEWDVAAFPRVVLPKPEALAGSDQIV